jgi:imidazolonepropionase-like amidohydrolase
VGPTKFGCPDGSCGVKFLVKTFFLILCSPFLISRADTGVPLVLQHLTVIDGTGRAAHPDQTVVIVGGRITAIGPASQIKFDKSARVIDGQGKFLIPGLWDMHVHIAGVSADPSWSKDVLLPLLLANGITGVRDMGGDLDALLSWKRDIESGKLLGPHIVATGPWLAGSGKKTPEQFPVANADEARAAVRELKKRGADFIKVISLPSRDSFFAVADEARTQSISFVGHLPLDVDAAEASDAGMHSIEHLYYSNFALSVSSREAELRERLAESMKKREFDDLEKPMLEAESSYSAEKAAALWKILKKNGTWVTPTLASLEISTHPQRWDSNHPDLAFVPPSLAKQWRASIDDQKVKDGAASQLRQSSSDLYLTSEMHAAGVSLLAGSDSLDPFVFPGLSLHQELSQLVRAGLTPMEALQTATQGAAQFLGWEKKLGTIEAGKIADCVLLKANPMESIANAREIAAVIFGGHYLDATALGKMLTKASAAAKVATQK